jgi:hypothetical protein
VGRCASNGAMTGTHKDMANLLFKLANGDQHGLF